ncbi:MAG: Argininosuccinate lyase 1 [Firmicutes bacterium ADurb.Bin099]|nr:MAG: Argininosuccinate lyase 1 [Firmicutes bacterium ADurb.Bin099]
MEKLWKGRLNSDTDKLADKFNSSIDIDHILYKQDITCSIAHAEMLGATGIIPFSDAKKISECLKEILKEIDDGSLDIDRSFEDIHTFVEYELIKRLQDTGKMLHTARSRNDQVATDFKMYVKERICDITGYIKELLSVLADHASDNLDTVMPGYTHLQRAQPVTLGHYLMAYAMMFHRDLQRYRSFHSMMNTCPLGSGALAGTTYNTDRHMTAAALGFEMPSLNSIDGVSDRDFATDACYANSMVMMHLSRFCEELILWASCEFKFIEISDGFSTGSSIMPQKKNPDIAELIRGKSARTFSDLNTLLVMQKSLPLAYNKDMQEDKEAVFDSFDTVSSCLKVFTAMLKETVFLKDNMKKAAHKGFINATDCADYLVKKSLPFRDAYKITGQLVAYCIQNGYTLETLPLEIYKSRSSLFEHDVYKEISSDACVEKRISFGGPSAQSVLLQIEHIREAVNG